MLKNNWSMFKDIDALSKQLASDILTVAEKSIELSGSFKIVLAGGVSLLKTYKILRRSSSDWNKWNVYIGDERCLPLQDKDRNDYIIQNIWLNDSEIPDQNINFMQAELDIDTAAHYYSKSLENVGYFDLVLLSIGEDGHTASLFPNHLYSADASVVVEKKSPKYPKNRISMSYSRLNHSHNIFKIINGSSKKKAMEAWLNGEELPINKIYGDSERVFVCKNAF